MEKVFLFSRSDDNWERTKNVQIRISDELPTTGMTMFSGGEALGTFPGPATRGQTIEIHSGAGWEKKTGRYVIIQMKMGDAGDSLNLHEAYAVGILHATPTKSTKGKVLSMLWG